MQKEQKLERILNIIYRAIDNLDDDQEFETLIKEPDTILFGKMTCLNSLTMVRLIAEVESIIDDEFNLDVSTFANDKMISEKHSPLRTIRTFAEFIIKILEEQGKL